MGALNWTSLFEGNRRGAPCWDLSKINGKLLYWTC